MCLRMNSIFLKQSELFAHNSIHLLYYIRVEVAYYKSQKTGETLNVLPVT